MNDRSNSNFSWFAFYFAIFCWFGILFFCDIGDLLVGVNDDQEVDNDMKVLLHVSIQIGE